MYAADYLDRPLAGYCDGPLKAVYTRNRTSRPHKVDRWDGLLQDVMEFKDQHDWGGRQYPPNTPRRVVVHDEGAIAGKFLTLALDPVNEVIEKSGLTGDWTQLSAYTRTWHELDFAGYMAGQPKPDFGWECFAPGVIMLETLS